MKRYVLAVSVAIACIATAQAQTQYCLLYTSDAADERSSVDLGGRRIIKKKKTREQDGQSVVIKMKHRQVMEHNLTHETEQRE